MTTNSDKIPDKTFVMEFFRKGDGGVLTRYKMELDQKRVVLKEGPADDSSIWGAPFTPKEARMDQFKQLLTERGYKFKEESGVIIPTYTPPVETTIINFQHGQVCDFPDYPKWRAEYDTIMAIIEEENCTQCERTRRQRKFTDELRDHLKRAIVPHAEGNDVKATSSD